MMMTRRLILLGVCLGSVFAPSIASAGWLGWLEQMSGPGPFKAKFVYVIPIYCKPLEEKPGEPSKAEEPAKSIVPCGALRADRVKFSIEAEVTEWDSGPREEFSGDVRMGSYQVIAYKPTRDLFAPAYLKYIGRALDVGAGGGFFHVTGVGGSTQGHWIVPALSVRARLVPSEWLPEAWLKAHPHKRRLLSSVYLLGGRDALLTHVNFVKTDPATGVASKATFGREVLKTGAIIIDLTRLVPAW